MKNKQTTRRASNRGVCLFEILDKGLLFLLVLLSVVFIVLPICYVMKQSFVIEGKFTLSVYQEIFRKKIYLLNNSVYVALLSAVCSTVMSLCVAAKVCFSGKKVKSILTTILLISMVSPPFISSLAYIQLFGRNGSITRGILGLSVNPYGATGVIVMQTVFFTALNALLLIGIMDRIDVDMIRASKDMGANNSRTFCRIVIPLIRPALLVCFLLSFVRSMADYGTPIVIGGRYENIATEIYMQIIGYANLEKSAALNVLLLIPAILIFSLYRYLMKKSDQVLQSGTTEGELDRNYRPGGIMGAMISIIAVLFYGTMGLEYGSIFVNSFSKVIKNKRTFSLGPLQALIGTGSDTFLRSIGYALIVAVAGTLIGVLLAYYIERRNIKLGGFLDFIVTMPYMLPGSCFGIGYILAFNHGILKLTGTAAIVILNMIFKQLSITTQVTSASLTQIPKDLDSAARDLGANKIQVLKDIILPNLKNAFAVGFVNNFTCAMVTAGAVIFLISPGKKIAVFTLFDAINSGRYSEASMISTTIIVCTVMVNLIFIKFTGKRRK